MGKLEANAVIGTQYLHAECALCDREERVLSQAMYPFSYLA
jgi:hypothetical protein